MTHLCLRQCIWLVSAERPGGSCPGVFVLLRVSPPQTPPSLKSNRPTWRHDLSARGPGWRWSDASDWCPWWSEEKEGHIPRRKNGMEEREAGHKQFNKSDCLRGFNKYATSMHIWRHSRMSSVCISWLTIFHLGQTVVPCDSKYVVVGDNMQMFQICYWWN